MAEGATTSLKGLTKQHIADFVHGTDGFGNTSQAAVEVRARAGCAAPCARSWTAPPGCKSGPRQACCDAPHSCAEPQGRTVSVSAAEWLVEQVTASPGQVSVLALGPLTNIALALQLDERVTRDLVRTHSFCPAFSLHSLGASLRPVPGP